MSSPAFTPTMPAPRIRPVPGSAISFVRPSGRPMPSARPDAPHGIVATSTSTPRSFASVSVRPIHAISGSV